MTNFEKHKEEIIEISKSGDAVALVGNCLVKCRSVRCSQCAFYNDSTPCDGPRMLWMYQEYEEPKVDWSNVPVDTKILISTNNKSWTKRYFAGLHSNGNVMAWRDGRTSFSATNSEDYSCWEYAKLYSEVDWAEEE